jgi:hypothetical protein
MAFPELARPFPVPASGSKPTGIDRFLALDYSFCPFWTRAPLGKESRDMKLLRRWKRSRSGWLVLVLALGLGIGSRSGIFGQQILQYGFETKDPVWKADRADAPYKVLAHHLTDEFAHGGQRCEHIQIKAEKGNHIYYTFQIGRAPISEDLNVGLYLRSNRPGVQLLCRVVLPRERDPANVGQPLTVLVRCEPYQNSGRWKLLFLNQPVKRLREQQQLLQAQLGRDVVTADAYISELVLNVYDGPGQVDVWIDDLEVGPVYDQPTAPPAPPTGAKTAQRTPGSLPPEPEGQPAPSFPTPGRGQPQATPVVNARSDTVQLRGSQLLVSGQKFFPIGIRHTGTPLKVLREAGFNTVWMDESTPNDLVQDAVNLGFWLVPTITPPQTVTADGRLQGHLTSTDTFVNTVSRFQQSDAVLCWDLGSNLTADNFPEVARTARAFRLADPMRPVSADVWDGFRNYSRSLEQFMVGVHRWPLMTALELEQYRDWLVQRRRLMAPGAFCWTWVQNHLPDWFLQIGHNGGNGKEPMGPSPEQVRLLAYTAIGCGYRGLAFWSDRFLADSHTGRDRLLGLALLNQELQLLEPILLDADASKEPEWIGTSHPDVKASILRTPRGILVLLVWLGKGSQFVPGQAASQSIDVTVPLVPATAGAWEISPGQIQAHRTKRVLGGTQITLHNFSLTSAILFTSDLSPTGAVVRLQDQQRRLGGKAAFWAEQEAREELSKVEQVQSSLQQAGHAIADTQNLLKKTRDLIESCAVHRRNGEHSEAYSDAQVALRALRVLMRAQWKDAVRNLDNPVASPYAVSYFTLPRHYKLLDELRQSEPGANVLPDGNFETPPDKTPAGWLVQEVPSLDGVEMTARRVNKAPLEGKQCLRLQIYPKGPMTPRFLERSFLAIHSPFVRLKPGTLVRITAWVNTEGIDGSPDGALIYDSAGGEPLAYRVTGTKGWRRVMLYRQVPESGKINVTLATSGVGIAYFDDVRIEPLVPAGQRPSSAVSYQSRQQQPAASSGLRTSAQ